LSFEEDMHVSAQVYMLHAAQGAFVVTFGRAGEDKKFNKLGDVEATLQGFAGADYDLQVSFADQRIALACVA